MSDKTDLIQPDRGQEAIAIHLVNKEGFEAWAKNLSGPQRAALAAQKFEGGGFQVGIVLDGEGWFAVGGVADPDALSSWCMAWLAEALPAGTYRRADGEPGAALFGWQTAQYRFTRYRDDKGAEGPRVLLAREAGRIALALASESEPELIIDFATLTGAARGALGPDLPAMFAREDATAEALATAGK